MDEGGRFESGEVLSEVGLGLEVGLELRVEARLRCRAGVGGVGSVVVWVLLEIG